ncbi:MAG: hypothetical protein K0U64_07455 [Actinomycetia bacterium]|nr:hypothetical protein [Actinomycetes bacterium]
MRPSPALIAALPSWLNVDLEIGAVPETLPDGQDVFDWLTANQEEAIVRLESGTALLVTGSRLVLSPAPNASDSELAYVLYSFGTRLVLTLRREFSLHSSAFRTDTGAVALLGRAHAGKSTTLLGMRDRGYEAIVDDLLPIQVQGTSRLTCSGWPRPAHVRTRTSQMLAEWGAAPELASSMRPDAPRLAHVVQRETRGISLVGGVLLVADQDTDGIRFEQVQGARKLAAIHATTDRWGQVSFGGRKADFFRWASAVANALPMFRLTRPSDPWCLPDVLDRVEQALADPDELGSALPNRARASDRLTVVVT